MHEVIFKYRLNASQRNAFAFTEGYQVLSIQVQYGVSTMWVKTGVVANPKELSKEIEVFALATGELLDPVRMRNAKYFATTIEPPFELVWHWYIKEV
jgi:hypothetical protein